METKHKVLRPEDLRLERRLGADHPLCVSAATGVGVQLDAERSLGRILNWSARGVCLELKFPVPNGLPAEFSLAHYGGYYAAPDLGRFVGEVRWVRPADRLWTCGLQLEESLGGHMVDRPNRDGPGRGIFYVFFKAPGRGGASGA